MYFHDKHKSKVIWKSNSIYFNWIEILFIFREWKIKPSKCFITSQHTKTIGLLFYWFQLKINVKNAENDKKPDIKIK